MATSQGRQDLIVKALSTEAHPIDPLLGEGVEIQPTKTGGIHFQTDLRSALQPKVLTQGLQQLADLGGGEQLDDLTGTDYITKDSEGSYS